MTRFRNKVHYKLATPKDGSVELLTHLPRDSLLVIENDAIVADVTTPDHRNAVRHEVANLNDSISDSPCGVTNIPERDLFDVKHRSSRAADGQRPRGVTIRRSGRTTPR